MLDQPERTGHMSSGATMKPRRNILQHFITEDRPVTQKINSMFQNQVLFSSDTYEEFLLENFLQERYLAGVSASIKIDRRIRIKKEEVEKLVNKLAADYGMVYSQNKTIVLSNDDTFIQFMMDNKEITWITIYSVSEHKALEINATVEPFVCLAQRLTFEWIYSAEGHSMTIQEEYDEKVNPVNYPFIKDFDTFYQRFFDSRANILILQGPPGTGKTSLLRDMMLHMDRTAYVTYDGRVLDNDRSFANYMHNDEAGAFIIEDADLHLRSRQDGNSMVSRFLNIGDGLIKLKNKKLIFSTNLPNLNDIDQALIRPGRCFDIVQFRALSQTEADAVAATAGREAPQGKKAYTLAEVYNSPVFAPKRTFGFT